MEKAAPLFICSDWAENQWIYCPLWVGFLYTAKLNPEESRWILVSKKGIEPSSSHSDVNFMVGLSVLTLVKKLLKSCASGQAIRISSTYLNQSGGCVVSFGRSSLSRCSM